MQPILPPDLEELMEATEDCSQDLAYMLLGLEIAEFAENRLPTQELVQPAEDQQLIEPSLDLHTRVTKKDFRRPSA
jgi:hypothetical protein